MQLGKYHRFFLVATDIDVSRKNINRPDAPAHADFYRFLLCAGK
jgi:hypothetical protein